MNEEASIKVVYQETVDNGGFLEKLSEGVIDDQGFERLMNAINSLCKMYRKEKMVRKKIAAYLLDVPWEVENRIEYYSKQNVDLGNKVNSMSENLRKSINDLFWEDS